MNLQSLIVVVLRLMALNFLLQVAVQLTPQILSLSHLYGSSPPDNSRSFAALSLLVLAGLIAAALILWFLAFPIARLVTKGVPYELSFGAVSLVDCYSIAFIGVGLLYISAHLPQVLNWTHYLFKAAATHSGQTWKEGVQWYDVSNAFIPFILGVVLFTKGRAWAVVLARRQQATESPISTVERTDAPPHTPGSQ